MYEPAIRRALRLARGGYAYGGSPYDIYSGIQGLQPFQFNPAMPSTVDNIPSGQQGPSYMKPAYVAPAPAAPVNPTEDTSAKFAGPEGGGGGDGGMSGPTGGPGSGLGTPGKSGFGDLTGPGGMLSGQNMGFNAANMATGVALGAFGPVGQALGLANTISGIFGGPTAASMMGLSKDTANVNAVNGLKADPLTQKSYAPISPEMLEQSKAANAAVNTTAAAQTAAQTATSQQQAADRAVNNAAAMSQNMNASDLGQLAADADRAAASAAIGGPEMAEAMSADNAAAAAAEAANETSAADAANGVGGGGELGGGGPGGQEGQTGGQEGQTGGQEGQTGGQAESQGSGNNSGVGDGNQGFARGGSPHANNSANNAVRLARLIHNEMRSDPLFERKIQSILSRL